MSLIYQIASEQWSAMCSEYDAAVEAQYQVAVEETNGYMVNKRGKAKGITSKDLFRGSSSRAYLYASEELVAFWDLVPRMDKNKFERQWCASNGYN